jgi:hypothetical protein
MLISSIHTHVHIYIYIYIYICVCVKNMRTKIHECTCISTHMRSDFSLGMENRTNGKEEKRKITSV